MMILKMILEVEQLRQKKKEDPESKYEENILLSQFISDHL